MCSDTILPSSYSWRRIGGLSYPLSWILPVKFWAPKEAIATPMIDYERHYKN